MNALFSNIKFVVILIFFGIASTTAASAAGPVIDVWYGNDQRFGLSCQPQQWVNILGNVADPNGVASLTYSLNGQSAASLTIGPDGRRLQSGGDFNVELDFADLQPGRNTVELRATDTDNVKTSRTVTVEYTESTGCALPYTADWSKATKIEEIAQVVDGLWRLNNGKVRTATARLGYDRTIAIGDMEWENYEVTVPFTVHDIDQNCVDNAGCGGSSSHPLIGVLVRWTGYYQQGSTSPRWRWWPMGAIGSYRWQKYNPNPLDGSLNLLGNRCDNCSEILASDPSRNLPLGVRHIFKLRAETVSQTTYQYSFKMWSPDNQPEPSQWNLVGRQDSAISSPNGSVLLIAHHVDASFEKVTVTPIGKQAKDTIGLYAPAASAFYLKNSNAGGTADISYRYGPAGANWLPIMGDWDNDGVDTAGLYDQRRGIFYLKNSHSGGKADISFRYGPTNADWEPIVGDWNRDGKDTVGLYDRFSGTFFLRDGNSGGRADYPFRFGPVDPTNLIPLAGDWNDDGRDTVGLYHQRTGVFYLKNSHSGGKADKSFRYGPANAGWEPVVGDWNGNGEDTIGLYRLDNSQFYLRDTNTAGAANRSFRYGPAGQSWWPLTGQWK